MYSAVPFGCKGGSKGAYLCPKLCIWALRPTNLWDMCNQSAAPSEKWNCRAPMYWENVESLYSFFGGLVRKGAVPCILATAKWCNHEVPSVDLFQIGTVGWDYRKKCPWKWLFKPFCHCSFSNLNHVHSFSESTDCQRIYTGHVLAENLQLWHR